MLGRILATALSTAVVSFVLGALALPAAAAAATPSDPGPGSPGPQVLGLQMALDQLGAQIPLTGQFDPATAHALANAPVDMGAPLLYGQSGTTVKALQAALTGAGLPVAETGLLGPFTDELLMQFVRVHGLRVGPIALQQVEGATPLFALMSDLDGLVGARYAWGGTSPATGFDCSGLVRYVYGHIGIDLPHSSFGQWDAGRPVSAGALEPGDLVFFDAWGGGPSHVGIYIGNGEMIHAGNYDTGVEIASLSTPYWSSHFIGARRVM